MAATITIFLGWVWAFSDFSSFVQRTLVVAGEIGRSRMTPSVIAHALTFNVAPNLFQIDLVGVFSGGIAVLVACFNCRKSGLAPDGPARPAILLPFFAASPKRPR
jgi:hypothetical protein